MIRLLAAAAAALGAARADDVGLGRAGAWRCTRGSSSEGRQRRGTVVTIARRHRLRRPVLVQLRLERRSRELRAGDAHGEGRARLGVRGLRRVPKGAHDRARSPGKTYRSTRPSAALRPVAVLARGHRQRQRQGDEPARRYRLRPDVHGVLPDGQHGHSRPRRRRPAGRSRAGRRAARAPGPCSIVMNNPRDGRRRRSRRRTPSTHVGGGGRRDGDERRAGRRLRRGVRGVVRRGRRRDADAVRPGDVGRSVHGLRRLRRADDPREVGDGLDRRRRL